MKFNNINVGIIGASGLVGQELIKILYNQSFPQNKLFLYSRQKKVIQTLYGNLQIDIFEIDKLKACQIIFLAVNSQFSKKYAFELSKDSYVIDNSSAFRYQTEIPLVIPEINFDLEQIKKSKIIANPNCTTAIALMALYPIYQKYGLQKIIISTYQAASGAGKEGIEELHNQITNINLTPNIFPKKLAYNVIPHIDNFQENGYTKEEMKVVWEIQKILQNNKIAISCTAVRVPTIRTHSESITIETVNEFDISHLKKMLEKSPGVIVIDDPDNLKYPTPIDLTDKYEVGVGRIRRNLIFGNKGLDFFICGDQLLRGASLNAILIAQKLIALNESLF